MKTKNKGLIVLSIVCIFFIFGCEDYILDKPPRDIYSEVDVWDDVELAKKFQTAIYNGLGNWATYPGWWCGIFTYSDLCITNDGTGEYPAGAIAPENLEAFQNIWPLKYQYIRMANIFLSRIDDLKGVSDQEKIVMKGEVKFIRASMYFDLIKLWGGVPLITTVFELDDDFMVPRNDYEEIVDWIVNELDEVAEMVPAQRPASEFGKVTKGACLATKSNVLLYANSKLHDPATLPNGPLFDYTKNTWQECANAAKAVIDMPQYSLKEVNNWRDYQTIFNRPNPEIVFGKAVSPIYSSGNDHIMKYIAPRTVNGYQVAIPTHNFAQEFQMANGKSIDDPDSGYDPSPETIYSNRELRFYADIIYDGIEFQGKEIKFWGGGGEDIYIITGYEVYKYLDEAYDLNKGYTAIPWTWIRLAELYLNYAEAQYEMGNEVEAREYINIIRNRVGLPDINSSGEDMFKDLQHERKIELCFEDHRFFDVLRWMIAEEANNEDALGIAWKEVDGKKDYDIIKVLNRSFPARQYYLPIPIDEMNKSDLEQNPGY